MKRPAAGIVLYRSERHIVRALDSLAAQTLAPAEVVVVDNASGDAGAALAASHPLKPLVLRNEENTGFARAQNQAIRRTSSDYYLAMNPDLFLAPDFLERMVAALDGDERIGWAQGKVLFADADGTPTDTIYTTGHVMRADYTVVNRGYGCADDGRFDEPGDVFGANGAAAFYRRAMIEDVSVADEFFDEGFFLYWDDVDVDERANAAGWRCRYVPDARAWHVAVGSGGFSTDRVRVEFRKNRYLSLVKNRGPGGVAKAWAAGFPENAFRFAVEAAFRPDVYLRFITGTLRQLGAATQKRRLIRKKNARRFR